MSKRRRLVAALCLAGCGVQLPCFAQEAPQTEPELVAALDEAIAEVRPDYQERLTLVAFADQFFADRSDVAPIVSYKIRLVEALANLRLGNFELSQQQASALCPKIPMKLAPEMRFRCDVIAAGLQMIQGNRQQSLAEFERIFAQDLSAVPDRLVRRFQSSYAVALNENGRSGQAVTLYEQILLSALTENNDELALLAGNNLTVILITQKDYSAARRTLEQLEPAFDRSPNSLVRGSLMLHDFELRRVAGELDRAIDGLQRFIDQEIDDTPLMMGSAHKLLADALRDKGELELAQSHAETATQILSGQSYEETDARLTLAEILIRREQYAAAIELIQSIDRENEPVPTRRVQIHRLLLEAQLQQAGRSAELASFKALVAADDERDLLASTTRTEYLDAKLTAAQRGLDLERAEAQVAAQARQSEIERRNNRLVLLLIGGAALALCLVLYIYVNRRAARQRLREKQAQNEQLEVLVANKTKELRDNLAVQAEMTRALERTKTVEAIGVLAGNVAHDFNNLLQVIAGSNETLSRDATTPEQRTAMLSLSNSSVEHAARIVHQLLAYSRQQNLESSPISFSDFLQENRALLRSALGEENELHIDDQSQQARVFVDSAQLLTSILNLVSNASDAMPSGGRLRISTQLRQLDTAQCRGWNDLVPGEYLSVAVSDNGQGMTEEQLAKACEPFFTTKDTSSGTGLGLSSVHGFVKQSGGDLTIRSVRGEGTEVEILLPTTHRNGSAVSISRDESRSSLAGRRLLLVEDNAQVAKVLDSLLRKLELNAVLVNSGREAQERLCGGDEFDILLTDVRMPGDLSGPDLARWAASKDPNITVLLMSGFSESADEAEDLPLIRKPFSLSQLKDFLHKNAA